MRALALTLVAAVAGALAAASGARDDAPLCSAPRLAVAYVTSGGAAGSVDVEYSFRNRGPGMCSLSGYPKVAMLSASARPVHTSESPAPGAYGVHVATVALAPGGSAYFGIHYAAATGFGNLKCPASAALAFTPPGAKQSLTLRGKGGAIQPYGGSIPHLQCGIVHVSALSAKRVL